MAGRGVPAAVAPAAGRPRGRPNKVTKPPSRGRTGNSQSSIPTDALEAHLAAVKADHEVGSRQSSEARDGSDEDHVHDHDHDHEADHDHDMDAAGDHDQRQFDYGAASANAAAHALMANGPGGHTQTEDSDIHPALQGLTVPHTGADQQAQAQAQQAFAMEAPMHADSVRTATDVSKESGYTELVIDSALSKRLSDADGVRLAVQRRQDQILNLKRRSNVEALLAHVSGQEAHSPCKSCHKGYGPWNGCIVVSGLMCGSCANCWFNASGSRCSFHETNLPQTQQHVPAVVQNSLPQGPGFPMPPTMTNAALAAIPQSLAPAPPSAAVSASSFLPFGSGSLDQWVRGSLDRSLSEMRNNNDPHSRYQARIEAATRTLAVAVAEYNDFLNAEHVQEVASEHQQQQGVPRPQQEDDDP